MSYSFRSHVTPDNYQKTCFKDLMIEVFPRHISQEAPRIIEVGETDYISVYANKIWNDSGIHVNWGQRYVIIVLGDEKWMGGSRVCSPNGYESSLFKRPL